MARNGLIDTADVRQHKPASQECQRYHQSAPWKRFFRGVAEQCQQDWHHANERWSQHGAAKNNTGGNAGAVPEISDHAQTGGEKLLIATQAP
ncbi:hypothetical protein D9M68_945430 [compost metagenome]